MDEIQQAVSIETLVEQPASVIVAKNIASDIGRNALSNWKNISSATAVMSKDLPCVLAGVHDVCCGTINVSINYHY